MPSRFEKNPVLTLFCVVTLLIVVCALIAEIALRFTISYDIGYYTAVKKQGVYEYPYGTISVNSLGLPDGEFDLDSSKPRIGYFGDSIFMGVGAGDGYRMTDILEKDYPDYDHWTIAMMGDGLREKDLLDFVDKYNIKYVVYGFNLNDLLPPIDAQGRPISQDEQSIEETSLQSLILNARYYTDWLRGKSYLYTVLRNGFKNILERMGYGYIGLKSVEFYPSAHDPLIRDVARRFNHVDEVLEKRGVGFCMIIFPYEMQISEKAAQTYRALGINWEEGFENGSTQDIFKSYLKIPNIYDARDAFDSHAQESPAGTYFVYNKGDKIDYNHPNREGHKLIAEGLKTAGSCAFLK